jgi:hypothetical protein
VLLAEGDSMVYVYDFGDDWRHQVVLEKIVLAAATTTQPLCLAVNVGALRRRWRAIRGMRNSWRSSSSLGTTNLSIFGVGPGKVPCRRVQFEGGKQTVGADAVAG